MGSIIDAKANICPLIRSDDKVDNKMQSQSTVAQDEPLLLKQSYDDGTHVDKEASDALELV